MATESRQARERPGFFRNLFGKHKRRDSLSRAASESPRLLGPRKLPRTLADASFADTLQSLWEQGAGEEAAVALHRECVEQLKRVRDLRVPTVASAGPVSGAIVSIELTLAGSETHGVYCAPSATRAVTRAFGECRLLLDLLATCVEPNDPCGCGSDVDSNCERCVFRDKMRAFLNTCWVHPPVVHGTTMQWGGGDGGVTAGIRKSVLAASLRVILAFARGEYDVAGDGRSSSAPPPTKAPEPPVSTDRSCRARFEVALVVRDFLQLGESP